MNVLSGIYSFWDLLWIWGNHQPANHQWTMNLKDCFEVSDPHPLMYVNFISIYKKRSSFHTKKKGPWYLTVVILWYAVAMSPCLACFLLNKKSKRCVVSWHAMSYEWPTTKSSWMLVNSQHLSGWHATYATSTTWRNKRFGDTKTTGIQLPNKNSSNQKNHQISTTILSFIVSTDDFFGMSKTIN